jgi:hypothetical protein
MGLLQLLAQEGVVARVGAARLAHHTILLVWGQRVLALEEDLGDRWHSIDLGQPIIIGGPIRQELLPGR